MNKIKNKIIFLLQNTSTEETLAVNDAIQYQSWLFTSFQHHESFLERASPHTAQIGTPMSLSENNKYFPVGTLEYCIKIAENQGFHIRPPDQIPESLRKGNIAGREIRRLPGSEAIMMKNMFLKNASRYKGYTGIPNIFPIPVEEQSDAMDFYVSEPIDIKAEWRIFVFNKDIVGVHYYSGDHGIFPNMRRVKTMIAHTPWRHAYTLDVGITDTKKTVLIETHPFVACGLYGFHNLKILLGMHISGFYGMFSKMDA